MKWLSKISTEKFILYMFFAALSIQIAMEVAKHG